MTLLPLLVGLATAAPPAAEPTIRPDVVLMTARLALRDGDVVPVTSEGISVSQWFSMTILQIPEGAASEDYRCAATWSGIDATATPLVVDQWPEIWPGAAWHVDTSSPPTTTGGRCDRLDPERFGGDPLTVIGAAGWNVGFGPLTPRVVRQCNIRSRSAASTVVVYMWMDGARPFPLGAAVVEAIDLDGELTGEDVADAATSPTAPDGLYAPVAGLTPCTIGLGL